VPPYTATAVKRLEDAGVVMLGKANMDEFAMGPARKTPPFKSRKTPSISRAFPAAVPAVRRGGRRAGGALHAGQRYGRLHPAARGLLRRCGHEATTARSPATGSWRSHRP
jgi:aspartyl-tRNA(Asn)/glutamyl-tRNA(Gln) amidotransferase subunit A